MQVLFTFKDQLAKVFFLGAIHEQGFDYFVCDMQELSTEEIPPEAHRKLVEAREDFTGILIPFGNFKPLERLPRINNTSGTGRIDASKMNLSNIPQEEI